MTHTLTDASDDLVTGTVYKFAFRASNLVGESSTSNTAHYALVDEPQAPEAPVVMLSHTSETEIAVQWPTVASTQEPGS